MSRHARNPAQLASRLHRTAKGIRELAESATWTREKERVSAWANTCDEAATRLEADAREHRLLLDDVRPSTPDSVAKDAARARQFADRLQRLTREEPR